MRLTSFEVQGFKNLVAPVKLTGLGPINVLHGANNVGKSNLLQALGMFFRFLSAVGAVDWRGHGSGIKLGKDYFAEFGATVTDLFSYAAPGPIHMVGSLSVEDGELALAGIQPLIDCKEFTIAMSIESFGTVVNFRIRSFRFAEIIDLANAPPDADRDAFAVRVAEFVAARGVSHVNERRQLDTAIDALYDASVSADRKRAMQWRRFVDVMSAFRDVLGEGGFIAVLPRGAAHADLLYETPTMRVPLRALGSGVQQMVALFGHVLTCGASLVSVEEPELSLRWTLQERVRDALRDLVGKEGAPSQLFLTSHSGAFETSDHFYLMHRQAGAPAPVVERRPVGEVALVVGGPAVEAPVDAPRAPTHVSGEGTLRLPERIRRAVGVEHGGGVCFVDKGEGVVEMMSDDTFLRHAGLADDDA